MSADEFSQLLSMSWNATLSTLSSAGFKLPPEEVKATVDALFLDLGRFLLLQRGEAIRGILDVVTDFFDSLFPTVVVFAVNDSDGSLVPPDQRACLRKARRDLSPPAPFAGAVARLSRDLDRSLGVVRVLLDAFDLAVDVVNATAARAEGLDAGCRRAVTRLLYCSYCDGHAVEVRPCRGPCVDVARRCLAGVGDLLNVPWNLFVEAVEEVAMSMREAVDLRQVLRSLHVVVADGVLKTMETTQKFHAQVEQTTSNRIQS